MWIVLAAARAGALETPLETVPEAATDFSRYQIILDKKPFGDIASAGVPAGSSAADSAAMALARNLRIASILQVGQGEVRVGLVDQQSRASFILGIGETSEQGFTLVSVNLEDSTAVLRVGTETIPVKLEPAAVTATTKGPPGRHSVGVAAQPNAPTRILSYTERRRQRDLERAQEAAKIRAAMEQVAPPSPTMPTIQTNTPTAPRLSGAELEKHLQEYQMEVIRKGLPPLPIPLTPEMDTKLVQEGVLPPQ